jgi:protein transport protein SEC61 subunit gamma-like protein
MNARNHVHHTATRATPPHPPPAHPTPVEPATMEVADVVAKPMRDFAKDSVRLVKKCTKPDAREFWKIASRTATGFVVMGFVGFFVKLIFVPINQIILSS